MIGLDGFLLFTEVAICPNNNEIQVYKRTSSGWKLLQNLQEHDMHVMGIDWAPNTNRIVTCSADKNAYVWTQEGDGKWNPAWVLLRINRAATCVKWSPLGMMLVKPLARPGTNKNINGRITYFLVCRKQICRWFWR